MKHKGKFRTRREKAERNPSKLLDLTRAWLEREVAEASAILTRANEIATIGLLDSNLPHYAHAVHIARERLAYFNSLEVPDGK